VLALLLDRPADQYLDIQRAAHLERMRALTELKRSGGTLGLLLGDHSIYRLEADLRWMDHTVREHGTTVILVTHDARVAAYADREVIVRDGKVSTLTGSEP
jgi:hypothetical protein